MVKELLNMKQRNRFFGKTDPQHIYIYCRGMNVVRRFLKDARDDGFTFRNSALLPDNETDTVFTIHPDLTINNVGWAGHILFHNGKKAREVLRIDYGKYLSGARDYVF